MESVYLYDAVRTPRGIGRPAKGDKAAGKLAEILPQALFSGLIDALRDRAPNFESNLASLSLGCVGQVNAQGGHLALVSRQTAKLPSSVSVQTINNNCISSLTALANGVARANDGRDQLHLAGGVECLSQVGFLADSAPYYTDMELAQRIAWTPPVLGADLIATLYQLTKEELDAVTLRSHQNAANAWAEGFYDQWVIPVVDDYGSVLLNKDELIRPNLQAQDLTTMPPAFADQGALGFDAMMLSHYPEISSIAHLHSFANCPGMADGASAVLLGTRAAGEKIGLKPRAKIIGLAEAAGQPVTQLEAGFLAMNTVLHDTGTSIGDFQCIEFMEAFAAVPAKFLRDHQPDVSKVNPNGGHLAMGHPMGATGTILVGQCLHQLAQAGGGLGLVVGTAGGGLGAALAIEHVATDS